MSLKSVLLKIYYLPMLSKPEADANQRLIRDTEWDAVVKFIPHGSKFLDVGCGAGYAMKQALLELGCDCDGIDPDPGSHGVGRYTTDAMRGLRIVKGEAEALPYNDNTFDVVYCSHVLEHVADENKSLQEMKRVMKPGGTLIIGMPTATMAFINLLTELFFTTHHRFVNFFLRPFVNTGYSSFVNLFVPPSHSPHRAKTVFFDLKHYRISNWRSIVELVFKVERTLLPALYPYPQYWQLFKMRVNASKSSSVFFICKK